MERKGEDKKGIKEKCMKWKGKTKGVERKVCKKEWNGMKMKKWNKKCKKGIGMRRKDCGKGIEIKKNNN
jgi:hypothetical protein